MEIFELSNELIEKVSQLISKGKNSEIKKIVHGFHYADLAENYVGDSAYEPGTVLVFGGEAEVTTTNTKSDHRIAGVVTTNPAHLMNSALEGETVVGVALQGRVPCKVLGKVEKGDMLVTAAKEGYAIVNNTPGVGQVLGKAVGTKEDDGYGIVEVVVGRV